MASPVFPMQAAAHVFAAVESFPPAEALLVLRESSVLCRPLDDASRIAAGLPLRWVLVSTSGEIEILQFESPGG